MFKVNCKTCRYIVQYLTTYTQIRVQCYVNIWNAVEFRTWTNRFIRVLMQIIICTLQHCYDEINICYHIVMMAKFHMNWRPNTIQFEANLTIAQLSISLIQYVIWPPLSQGTQFIAKFSDGFVWHIGSSTYHYHTTLKWNEILRI